MGRVLVDGVMYGRQAFGGITRCFTETLSLLGLHHDGIQVILHLPGHCQAGTPRAKWIREIRDWDLRPQRVFGRITRGMGKARTRLLRPQIFHSTYYTSPYWLGMRSVFTVYDFIDERFPAMRGNPHSLSAQKRRVIESADAIVAISHSTKNDILTYTKAEESRIIVIHPGVNEAFLTASSSEADIRTFRETHRLFDNPYWLYVGNRGPTALYKNFGTLLRAFVQVAPQTGAWLVTVGGEPRLEPWQADLLIRNRLEQRVRLLPAMGDDDLRVAYSGAATFVFPSLGEGFGIPLLEAMACGTPVVASDIPVFREVAADSALYFDPHDEEALADAMIGVLDKDVRRDLVERGRKRVSQFSWDAAARKLGDVYKSLV